MKKSAFTLIELLITIAILAVFTALVLGAVYRNGGLDGYDEAYYNPETARVHEARNQVEQLRIQNELKAKELELLERQLAK